MSNLLRHLGRLKKARPLRILLVRTSPVGIAFRDPGPPPVAVPLGVLYLTSALREALGAAVEVHPTSLSTAVPSLADVPSFLRQQRPDVLGISASLVDEHEAAAVVEAARQLDPPPLTLLGGPAPTCSAERALRRTGADLALLGEAERSIVELARALLAGAAPTNIPGVAWLRADGALGMAPAAAPLDDVDALPRPAWDSVDIGSYSAMFNHNDWPPLRPPYAPLITSRGCPFSCSYCHNIHGKRFRPRCPTDIMTEIELLHDRYGVGEIHVVDDIFNFDGERVNALCRAIVKRGLSIALAFPNALRGDLLTREQLCNLRDAGCYSMMVSLESASPRILQRMHRRMNLERLAENVRIASELGLLIGCFVMFGYPGETLQDVELTLQWLRDSHIDFPRHGILAPFPGTVAAEHARQLGCEPEQMEATRGRYDWANRGLSELDPTELRRRIREGLDEIMAVPRRQRRMQAFWRQWGTADIPLMGCKPPAQP